jgi:hypothetical protein
MDIHHNTSLRSILEDDSISSASKTCIYCYLGKGARLWLVAKPYICLFRIAHSIFTSMLRFHLSLIQPLAFSLLTCLTCECRHELDAFNTHLTHCPFGSQQITTHDAIRNVMYALVRKNGHIVWKEWWYTLTS